MNGVEHAAVALRRLGVRLLAVGVVVGVLAAGLVLARIAMGHFLTPVAVGPGCLPPAAAVPISATGPSGLGAEQLANAATIVAVGRDRAVPERAVWIAVATALQESGLRNLDYGDRDSLGLFQQRPSMGWGSAEQVTDPRYSAAIFYDRLLQITGWADMELWEAAQAVQRSAFPTAYAKWEDTAANVLTEVGDGAARTTGARTTADGGSCADPSSAVIGDDPRPRPAGCTEDDPTTRGCVTPTTRFALEQVRTAFGALSKTTYLSSTRCFADRPANPTSDHPLGKGCDLFPGPAGSFASGRDVDDGWVIAEWFRRNAVALDVSYVIWQGQIWLRPQAGPGRWSDYTGGGVYDPADPVGGHYDHIHVSFRR
ncbi:hypothetical protein [Pseudonocardia parietis]|uniref:ARB-07466-like C-terminal domain-containing protein n=1 Tax=Pseudonocardia parietis TaxID=570936 RepID=A0ABS4W785_9PSEU|nr:hypothetical protein [Pseudonocardia parietis]MBP2371484.1 hypothetical protein [Pseudonocardia parietis]